MPVTEHRLEYRVLPRGEAVAALDVLREAAGLGPVARRRRGGRRR